MHKICLLLKYNNSLAVQQANVNKNKKQLV